MTLNSNKCSTLNFHENALQKVNHYIVLALGELFPSMQMFRFSYILEHSYLAF